MHAHLVLVTKYRREVFTKKIQKTFSFFLLVSANFEAELGEFEDDHVHVMKEYRANSFARNDESGHYDHPATLRTVAVALQLLLASTFSSNKHLIDQTKGGYAASALDPALKSMVCRALDQKN